MSLDEIRSILEAFGYKLFNIRGSHFLFKKPNRKSIVFPVHHNKVTKFYLKTIRNTLKSQLK